MQWSFKLRGEQVTFTILETVTAVRPTPEFRKTAVPSELALNFGAMAGDELVEGIAGKVTSADRQVFKRAGWLFVEPFPEVALAAEVRSPIPNAAAVHQVFLTNAGDLMIGTDLATVQLPSNLSEAEAAKLLADDQLSIVYRLKFAPNTFEVRLPPQRPMPDMINQLQVKTDRYLYAEPSLLQVITGRFKPKDPEFDKQWQHHNDGSAGGVAGKDLHSMDAWDITRGVGPARPVRIALVDNGMQISHPDLKDGIIGGGFFKSDGLGKAEFVRLQPGMADFPDGDHGTFCLGMAGERMNKGDEEGQGGCGSAPEADLIAIACPHDQTSTQTTLARAIHYAAYPRSEDDAAKPADGADVISCSLCTKNLLTSGLGDAISFAANQGRNKLGVPIFWAVDNDHVQIAKDKLCSHPDVIAVGRCNRQGLSDGSAFGPQLEFLAPGRDVFSTRSASQFNVATGTSFATPLAAGVAALVLACRPDRTVAQVRQLLRESCDQIGDVVGHHDEFGFGLLNAEKAVKKALQ